MSHAEAAPNFDTNAFHRESGPLAAGPELTAKEGNEHPSISTVHPVGLPPPQGPSLTSSSFRDRVGARDGYEWLRAATVDEPNTLYITNSDASPDHWPDETAVELPTTHALQFWKRFKRGHDRDLQWRKVIGTQVAHELGLFSGKKGYCDA